MTDRIKLVNIINNTRYGKETVIGNNFQRSFIEKIADNLIANGVTIQKWIPVTERLPKHGEIAICYLKFGENRMLQWDDTNSWWLGCGKDDDWQKKYITHWMPLPEPPKED